MLMMMKGRWAKQPSTAAQQPTALRSNGAAYLINCIVTRSMKFQSADCRPFSASTCHLSGQITQDPARSRLIKHICSFLNITARGWSSLLVAPCEKYPNRISRPTQIFNRKKKNNQSLRGGRLLFGSAGILTKKKRVESDRWLSSVGFHEKFQRPPPPRATHRPHPLGECYNQWISIESLSSEVNGEKLRQSASSASSAIGDGQ